MVLDGDGRRHCCVVLVVAVVVVVVVVSRVVRSLFACFARSFGNDGWFRVPSGFESMVDIMHRTIPLALESRPREVR